MARRAPRLAPAVAFSYASRTNGWRAGAPAGAALRVLRRPRRGLAELSRGAQRPVRVAQELARDDHRVGLPRADDLFGLGRGRDQTHGPGHHPGFLADALRERRLVARPHGNLRVMGVAADEQSMRSTPSPFSSRASSIDCSTSQPPSTQSVAEIRTKSGARSGQTVRTAAATSRKSRVRFSKLPPYAILALIAQRRQELVEEVAVRRVDLDHPEARGQRAPRCRDEAGDDLLRCRPSSSACGSG